MTWPEDEALEGMVFCAWAVFVWYKGNPFSAKCWNDRGISGNHGQCKRGQGLFGGVCRFKCQCSLLIGWSLPLGDLIGRLWRLSEVDARPRLYQCPKAL